jgi:hypothetical protein
MPYISATWSPAMDPTAPIEEQRRAWFKKLNGEPDSAYGSLGTPVLIGATVGAATWSPSESGFTFKCEVESKAGSVYSNKLTMEISIASDGTVASVTTTPAANGGPLPPPTAGQIAQL